MDRSIVSTVARELHLTRVTEKKAKDQRSGARSITRFLHHRLFQPFVRARGHVPGGVEITEERDCYRLLRVGEKTLTGNFKDRETGS